MCALEDIDNVSQRCDATDTGVKIDSDSESVSERGETTRLRGVTN